MISRLKSAISASKIKIAQQAHIISEQSILLRQAGCPRVFLLSNASHASKDTATVSRDKATDHFNSNCMWSDSKNQDRSVPLKVSCLERDGEKSLDAGETVLPHDQGEWNSVSNWVETCSALDRKENIIESPVFLEENSCHIIYSHTHNLNPLRKSVKLVSGAVRYDQGTGVSSAAGAPANATKPLSLQSGRDSNRVRYRKSDVKYHKTSSKLLTSFNNRATNDTSENSNSDSSSHTTDSNDEGSNSIPASPSFLVGSTNMLMKSSDGHDEGEHEENPLNLEDEPMSCSMFATCPQDTTSTTIQMAGGTIHPITPTNTHSVIPRKRPLKVNQIAELLSTRKRPRNKSPPVGSEVEGDVVDVVPVTPGARLVKNILDSEGWLAAQSPPKRGGRLEKDRKEAAEGDRWEEMGSGGRFFRTRRLDDHLKTSSNNNNNEQQRECVPSKPTGSEDGRLNKGNVHVLQESACGEENKIASNQIHLMLTNKTEPIPQASTIGNTLLGDAKRSTSCDTNELVMLINNEMVDGSVVIEQATLQL